MNVPGIPVDLWNQTAKDVYSPYLPVGREQTIGGGGNLPTGRIPNRGRESTWQHPFTVIPVWNSEIELSEDEQVATGRMRGAWTLTMTPGFVNGHAPAIAMSNKVIPPGVKIWGNKYGQETRTHARLREFSQVLLTDEWVPYMRAIRFVDDRSDFGGSDRQPAIPIDLPIFFRSIGAMAKEKGDFTSEFFSMATAGGSAFGDVPTAGEQFVLNQLAGAPAPTFVQGADQGDGFPEGDRYVHSCDVVLQIDRPSTRQIFLPDEFGFLRFAGFQIDPPDSGLYNARIYTTDVYFLPEEPTLEDVINGSYIEPKIDEIVMARVFFISPSIPMLDDTGVTTPDGSWIPFVRHEVFWNLSYAALNIYDPFHSNRDLDAFKVLGAVLGGGAAFLFIALTADFIEVQHDTISTLMNNTRVRTRFWTS